MLDRIETANGLTDIAGVRIELIKRGILVVLLASVAVAVTMLVMGWPR